MFLPLFCVSVCMYLSLTQPGYHLIYEFPRQCPVPSYTPPGHLRDTISGALRVDRLTLAINYTDRFSKIVTTFGKQQHQNCTIDVTLVHSETRSLLSLVKSREQHTLTSVQNNSIILCNGMTSSLRTARGYRICDYLLRSCYSAPGV
jgi:hypothetical protein